MVETTKPQGYSGPVYDFCDPPSGVPLDEEHLNGRCKYADPYGGILMADSENLAAKVATDIIKKMGTKLLTGNIASLRMATPAYVHSCKSYIDTLPYESCLLEHYARRFMAEAKTPIEKLQYLVGYKLGNCFVGITQQSLRQPLNPIVGETSVYVSDSGTTIYGEQTSHHPPISHFHVKGPKDCPFESSGYWEYNCKFYKTMQGLEFSQPGQQTLKMPCGTVYNIQTPTAQVTGILTSQKKFTFSGNLVITDKANNLEARVYFDANEANRRGYLGNWVGGGHAKVKSGKVSPDREDLVKINISNLPAKSKSDIVSVGTGSYLESISFDGKEPIWDINMKSTKTDFRKPIYEKDDPYLLLISDSACRKDAVAILNQQWEEAENTKHEMEEMQRNDTKARKAAADKKATK